MYGDMLAQTGLEVEIDFGHSISKAGSYSAFDHVYVHPGNDWGGSLNLYGGLASEAPVGLLALAKWEGPVTSVPIPMPNYSFLVAERLRKTDPEKVHPSWNKIDLTALADLEAKAAHLQYPAERDHFVLGDSHAISLYRQGVMMRSVPYQTLYGALKLGLDTFLPPRNFCVIDLYFGNIDIRHHLCRQAEPHKAAEELAIAYADAAQVLVDKGRAEAVYIHEPLPIENESRKVPKSGWYKGKPYWGTWAERNEIRARFINTVVDKCSGGDVSLIRWTKYLLNDAGELDFAHMERPQSVHLARSSWPYWTGPAKNSDSLEDFL